MRSDRPTNYNWGSICIYFENLLTCKILVRYILQESINFQLVTGDKIDNFFMTCKSPNLMPNSIFLENIEPNHKIII